MESLDKIALTCKLFNDIRILEQRNEIESLKVKLLLASATIYNLNKFIYLLLTQTEKTREYVIEKSIECGLKCDGKYVYTFVKLLISNNQHSMNYFEIEQKNIIFPNSMKRIENYLKFYFLIQKDAIALSDKNNTYVNFSYDEWIYMLLNNNGGYML